MRRSGYTPERAAPHDAVVQVVMAWLGRRGYPVKELPVDGHRPDLKRLEIGAGYVEVKTGQPNLAIEFESVITYEDIFFFEGDPVEIIHVPHPTSPPSDWRVHTPKTLRIIRGPLPPTGKGSNDPWYLCDPNGVPAEEFYPER